MSRIESGEEEDPDEQVSRLARTVAGMPDPPERCFDKKNRRAEFAPAPEMTAWLTSTYVSHGGVLSHKEHKHLSYAQPSVLWTNVENKRSGQRVVGTASMPSRASGDPWSIAQRERQLTEWFGKVPEFLITLDATYWWESEPLRRLAVAEHELLHCGQAKDAFGCPKFSEQTGLPIFTIRPHDVEAFVLEGDRYGAANSAGASADLFAAWKRGPTVTPAQIVRICGNR